MVKPTQTVRLSVFDHFVGLSIKELMRVCTIGRINYRVFASFGAI